MPERKTLVVALAVLMLTLSVACTAIEDDPPPRNPLADSPTTATVAPSLTAAPGFTVTSTPVGGDVTPPPASLGEAAGGRAIEFLAEWLGVPQTDIAVVSTEAAVWPDACLGVPVPAVCAQVVVAGFTVRMKDALGTAHTLHTDATGSRARWAGEATATGIVTALDLRTRRLTIIASGRPLELRIAPGTSWAQDDTPASMVGRTVTLGYDPASTASGPPPVAWVAVAPP